MFLTEKSGVLVLRVKIVPNSRRTQVVGILGDALKIKIAQPPEAGRANAGLIDLLADLLQIPAGRITLAAGHTQARKILHIRGLGLAVARARLGPAV